MTTRLRDALMGHLDELRYEPTEKRIRASLGDRTVVDPRRAMLVWEPARVVPSYAVPLADIAVEAVPVPSAAAPRPAQNPGAVQLAGRAVLDPSIPFAVHTTDGEPLVIRAEGDGRAAEGFRPTDPALDGYVILDFDGFDAWYEEDDRNLGHPRDPFHRIDVVRSSRHVRVELEGEVLADSTRPSLLFEPPLPARYYLPPEDVATDGLRPSATETICAYKGVASYWATPDGRDVAWSYPEPLHDAARVAGHSAFFNEHVDIVVDGTTLERPLTPWSR